MYFETTKLHGTHVALVTPFQKNGDISISSLKRLLDYQLEGGVDGLVLAGTTGEGCTLSQAQLELLVTTTVEHVQSQMVITVGAGSNNTDLAIEQTKMVKALGADAALSIGPYYNKPTQEGFYQHFSAIAESVDFPLIIYNVPSRTGSNIAWQTVAELSELPNIVAIKESTGDLLQLAYLVRECADSFVVLSGDDHMILPSIMLGAKGAVSVIGNEAPYQIGRLVQAARQHDVNTAREIHMRLLPLMDMNFIETNPIPVKCALSMMGLIEEHYHLPMTPLDQSHRASLHNALMTLNLLSIKHPWEAQLISA